jgi:hypothetical protein
MQFNNKRIKEDYSVEKGFKSETFKDILGRSYGFFTYKGCRDVYGAPYRIFCHIVQNSGIPHMSYIKSYNVTARYINNVHFIEYPYIKFYDPFYFNSKQIFVFKYFRIKKFCTRFIVYEIPTNSFLKNCSKKTQINFKFFGPPNIFVYHYKFKKSK